MCQLSVECLNILNDQLANGSWIEIDKGKTNDSFKPVSRKK